MFSLDTCLLLDYFILVLQESLIEVLRSSCGDNYVSYNNYTFIGMVRDTTYSNHILQSSMLIISVDYWGDSLLYGLGHLHSVYEPLHAGLSHQ